MADSQSAQVILIGCGCPLRSMGWYHAMQMLDKDGRISNADLTTIVEPWYLSEAAAGTPGHKEFKEWQESTEKEHGVSFYATVEEVPKEESDSPRLVIISARTADNPKLLKACLALKPTCIYLEKPGAPTVAELENMREDAASAGVKTVFMGFNKNVSSYLTKSRAFADEQKVECDVTLLHNNNYPDTEDSLAECFERNAEGMLKNMAIHEIAIAVTFYGVTVDTIASVEADKEYSRCRTLTGPASGQKFTDFDKLKFRLTTKSGTQIQIAADRSGGDDSVGIVTKRDDGSELARFVMPDAETVANVPVLQAKYGADAMPYFFAQDPDYLRLKQLVIDSCVDPTSGAPGVATIDVAIESLKVAEYLTPLLQEQLL